MPCGRLYAAFGLAALTMSSLVGALTMLAFAAGTWPGIALFQWVVRWAKGSQSAWARRVVGGIAIAAGILLTLEPLANASPFHAMGTTRPRTCCHPK
jgi:sulfite exporter TauE/SafE